jgi:hypothetical protein
MLTWDRIQSLYEPSAERHAKAAQLAGLTCPPSVFTALFHDRHEDPDLERLLRAVDFREVEWVQDERSAVALRQVFVDRAFQPAVDEAYRDILDESFIHERSDVVASWRENGTWIESPILLAGGALGSPVGDYLLVGSTRLWCLLAFLDQGVVAETARHRVRVGMIRR